MVLSSHLLNNGVTLVGTVRRDKRFLPHDFQKGTKMSKGNAMFAFTKTTTICAYKSNTKKHVVVLSTMHHSADRGTTNKPEIVESYNSIKGGVDFMNQMCHKFTTKRKTNRWPMLLFYNMLDLASIASIICWRKTFPEDTLSKKDMRAQFNIAISRELVQAQLDRRSELTSLSLYLRTVINTAVSVYYVTEGRQGENLHTQKKWGRCHLCPRKKDTKTVQRCSSCNNFVCKGHVKKQVLCDKC
ncbi:PiggyBac transposable element-derived protein 4 [Elysia marginata]|uniref:PiggyBac transposable element-derived protein 4 n=1 Tax=Elysia marginata TaxID=1093978 RepID=A0AAV4F1K2_9GAST|nr:PiggyBac transposable element-derived protein 4 [Elysia marginata]